MLHGLLLKNPAHSRPAALDMAEESKNLSEESFEQHKELTHLEHISSVSTPDEELRRRFKNEIGSIRKKAEQALVEALVKYHHNTFKPWIPIRMLSFSLSRKQNWSKIVVSLLDLKNMHPWFRKRVSWYMTWNTS